MGLIFKGAAHFVVKNLQINSMIQHGESFIDGVVNISCRCYTCT